MRRTLYAAAIIAALGIWGCNKNDDDDSIIPAGTPDKGTIRFKNTSGDMYDFYLDGARYGSLYGGDSSSFPSITAGAHNVKALQTANIVGTPILRQQIIYIYKDSVSVFSFP